MPLGFHVSKATTRAGKQKSRPMGTALREDMETLAGFGFKTPCAQIFVSGPQSFKETLSSEDKDEVRKFIEETGAQVVIHGAYVDHPWNRAAGSVHNIKQELRVAAYIGATGVVVHLGAGAASDDNLKYVIEEVTNLPDDVKSKVTLWLEIHTAKPSGFTYETPEKLQRLFERVSKCDTHGMKVGLCIDTAHLFSCGMALDTYSKAKLWLEKLPKVPVMMHLNDSASTLASGKDEHAMLCHGHLWGLYHPDTGSLPTEESGLMAILEWAELNDIVTILERDQEGTIADLTLIRRLGFFQD